MFTRHGWTLLALVGCAAVAGCAVHISERRLVHPTAGGSLNQALIDKAAPVFTLTHHQIVASEGARLSAVRLRQPNARATVLYFGGNGYTIERFGAWTASVFAPLGVDLFIADHRGYGQSEGTPTAAAMAADALVVFDYVAALPDPVAGGILVHGHSLGSFMAGHVAANRTTAGVVLESSATTTEEWVAASTPGYVKPFIRTTIADDLKGRGNLPNMPLIEEPLLILVGRKDKTTPPRLSEALYAASPLPASRKSLVVIPGAGHSDSMTHEEALVAYRKLLSAFQTARTPPQF